jgi:hypothetical protein
MGQQELREFPERLAVGQSIGPASSVVNLGAGIQAETPEDGSPPDRRGSPGGDGGAPIRPLRLLVDVRPFDERHHRRARTVLSIGATANRQIIRDEAILPSRAEGFPPEVSFTCKTSRQAHTWAGEGDVRFYDSSGHGSQEPTAGPFLRFEPVGRLGCRRVGQIRAGPRLAAAWQPSLSVVPWTFGWNDST